MKGCWFISVFILLCVNFTCYGNNFWLSMQTKLFGPTDESTNQYWLYTRDNPVKGHQLIMPDTNSVLYSDLKHNKDILFIIHGWFGDYADVMNVNITSAALQNNDVNVISVDWSVYSKATYKTATNAVPKVGTDLGDFINWLVSLGYLYNKMHIVGHSLGAHVAGYAGRWANGRIKRITGLDPAGPGWNKRPILSPSDAQYVECVHTCANLLGIGSLCGHADFFPNGGMFMPGCGINIGCSHSKAFYYFTATTVYPEKFFGFKCNSIDDAMDSNCNGEPALMGNNDLDKDVSGIYSLKTTEDYPYF